jgi:hypothetical protein
MSEADWNACTELEPMLGFLNGRVNVPLPPSPWTARLGVASHRKIRLFGVGCCRKVLHLLTDDRSWKAVEVAERLADQQAVDEDRQRARTASHAAITSYPRPPHGPSRATYGVTHSDAWQAAYDAWQYAVRSDSFQEYHAAQLLRCIFGPLPFRSITLDPSWLTPTVTSLATAIYEERAFDRLAILADALEDSACTNQEVLSHLRSGGEHSRGCWPVDLILGRE